MGDVIDRPVFTAAALSAVLGERRRLLVLAPHPGDEIYGCAGLIQRALAAQLGVEVVVATDGEAGDRHFPVPQRATLWQGRRDESRCAAQIIGLDAVNLSFWNLGDGFLDEQIDTLARALCELAGTETCVAAPWRSGGHPDDEALGLAAWLAHGSTGAALCQYITWGRVRPEHWPHVRAANPSRFKLTRSERAAKHRAASLFETQLPGTDDPAMAAEALDRLVSDDEWFLCP